MQDIVLSLLNTGIFFMHEQIASPNCLCGQINQPGYVLCNWAWLCCTKKNGMGGLYGSVLQL